MTTAICVGLAIWLALIALMNVVKYKLIDIPQCIFALLVIVSTCAVFQHFSSLLIRVLT